MSEGDYGNRPHAMEDDYFYKKDRELIEKMRRAAADEKAEARWRRRSGSTIRA